MSGGDYAWCPGCGRKALYLDGSEPSCIEVWHDDCREARDTAKNSETAALRAEMERLRRAMDRVEEQASEWDGIDQRDTWGTIFVGAAGATRARIAEHGLCPRNEPHDPHIETIRGGARDVSGNLLLTDCPGQASNCRNCDDRKCMACVFREVHDVCHEDCPMCRP